MYVYVCMSGNVVTSFFPLIIFMYVYIYFVGGRRQINKPVS